MKRLLSVIVCTYNRPQLISGLLRSLFQQETDGSFNYEVLVVDNDPQGRAKGVILKSVPEFQDRLRYLHEPNRGKSNALNAGILAAKGDIVAFTDDDVIVDTKWLMSINQCFDQYDCDCIGGRVLPQYPENTPEWIKVNQDLLCGPIVYHDYGEEIKLYQKPMIEFFGANMAFKRSVIQDKNLFRTDLGVGTGKLGEDTELFNRFLQNKKKIYYCGKALVWHPVELERTTLAYIARWNIALGRYRAIISENKTVTDDLVCYFGVPRYLVREMLRNAFGLAANILDKKEFLKHWISLFLDWGRAIEFKKAHHAKKLHKGNE